MSRSDIGRIAQELAARLERIRALCIDLWGKDFCKAGGTLNEILDLTDTAKPLGER